MSRLKHIKEIFHTGLQFANAEQLCEASLNYENKKLSVYNHSYNLNEINKVVVIGFGKASSAMATGVENVLKDRIDSGVVITKYGHKTTCHQVKILEAGHPLPDNNGRMATEKLLEVVKDLSEKDLVICLVSGGGSSLLVDIPQEMSINDYNFLVKELLGKEIDIREINLIRKHLGYLKGGKMLSFLAPAKVLCLVISDIVGDPIEDIASGPTVPQKVNYQKAENLLESLSFPLSSLNHTVSTKEVDVTNLVIGNNRKFLLAASESAQNFGYETNIVTSSFDGSIDEWLKLITDEITKSELQKNKICLLFGGEPLVNVNGKGMGGRNQHLALMLAIKLEGHKNIAILCVGTDGTDGPTEAAGAWIDGNTYSNIYQKGRKGEDYLKDFDSYNYFKGTENHLITGPTDTNVMDVVIVLV